MKRDNKASKSVHTSIFSPKAALLLVLALILLVSCGDFVPIEKLGDAKKAMMKAESVGAMTYAPQKLADARKALHAAHDLVSQEKKDDAAKKADEAKQLAEMATLITNAHLELKKAEEQYKIATEHIQLADDANAEIFAPKEFADAKTKAGEADPVVKGARKLLIEANKEKVSDAKKYEKVIADAKAGYATSEEADKLAMQARKICGEQVPSIKKSISNVEKTIITAESIGGKKYAPEKLQTARSKAAEAKSLTSDLKLKKALAELNEAKLNADEALIISKKGRAEDKIKEAKIKIDSASKSMAADDKKDELNGAKESLASSEKSLTDKRYDDSYNQAEEAVRLANGVIEHEAVLIARKKQEELDKQRKLQNQQDIKKDLESIIAFWDQMDKAPKHKVIWQRHQKQTLWRLAIRYYKDVRLWPRIFRVNADIIKDPDLIYPNQVLRIPPKNLKIPENLISRKEAMEKLKKLNEEMAKKDQPQQ